MPVVESRVASMKRAMRPITPTAVVVASPRRDSKSRLGIDYAFASGGVEAVVMVEAVDREVLMVGGRVEVETMAQEAVAAPLRCG